MKKYLSAWIAIVSLSTPAFAAHVDRKSNEERMVLSLIDNLCGDSWCEGEIADYNFEAVNCVPGQDCELVYSYELEGPGAGHTLVQKTCRLEHIRDLHQAWMKVGRSTGLSDAMLGDLNACLGPQ